MKYLGADLSLGTENSSFRILRRKKYLIYMYRGTFVIDMSDKKLFLLINHCYLNSN